MNAIEIGTVEDNVIIEMYSHNSMLLCSNLHWMFDDR